MARKTNSSPTKQDRRAVRSKRLIIDALRELVLEKDYKDISISDIVERADIGRATFYAHFEDKDHLGRFMFGKLLTQIEQEIQEILDDGKNKVNIYQSLVPSLALFRIAKEKHRWFKMNATNPEIGLGMLVNPLVNRLEARLRLMNPPPANDHIPTHLSVMYLISALVALLTNWVIEDMPLPPESMDSIYQTLAEPTLKRLTSFQNR